MNRVLIALGCAAAVAIAGAIAYRAREVRERRMARGSLGLNVATMGMTVTGSAVARVTGGSPPIDVYMWVEVTDLTAGRDVFFRSRVCRGLSPGRECRIDIRFDGAPGHDYIAKAHAEFVNRWGKIARDAVRRFSLGAPPSGELVLTINLPPPPVPPRVPHVPI